MRSAAVFDLDGTLISGSAERRLVRHLRDQRVIGPRQGLSALLWSLTHVYSREAMTVRNKAYWRGVREEDLRAGASELFEGQVRELVLGSLLRILEEHRSAGRTLVLLSGTPEPILEIFASELRVDLFRGTRLETRRAPGEEVLTGRIAGPHLYGERKRIVWEAIAAEHGFDAEESFAFADRYADRFLLERFGHPAAVHPDRRLEKVARERGWRILDTEGATAG